MKTFILAVMLATTAIRCSHCDQLRSHGHRRRLPVRRINLRAQRYPCSRAAKRSFARAKRIANVSMIQLFVMRRNRRRIDQTGTWLQDFTATSSSRASSANRGGCLGIHSMTSSARASNEEDTVRPSAFAVFKLITNSSLVGNSTGKLAALAPLKIWSKYQADR